MHLLDTGHFALEEEGDAIADHIRRFITTHVVKEDIIPVPSRK
ncbi:hypothetical protein [Nostoc sp. 'Lobaria pulmonaria (5183) cyanobiont']|nr:hypothetical protein [Nostoc sp. 'Lobaria pulmonaria (5183) cyanobiont']